MQYKSLKDDFYWVYQNSAVTSTTFTISDGDYTFYYGRAVKSPSETYLRINVGRLIRDYVWNEMPDFRDYDGVIVPHPDAMKVFVMRYAESGNEMERYNVLMDYEDVWDGTQMVLSEPVNTHADPRQKIFIGNCTKNDGTITIDVDDEYEGDYLTFEVVSGGTLYWGCRETGYERTIGYSMDNGETWTYITSVEEDQGDSPILRLSAGDIVKWKGSGPYGKSNGDQCSYFASYDNLIVKVYGNIASMSSWNDSSCPAGQFAGIFDGLDIVTAENVVIPYKTIGSNAFHRAFRHCSNMVKGPRYLPATTIGDNGYSNMYEGCTSLVEAPDLPALSIGEGCYYAMFNLCESLTKVPKILPASTLARSCYGSMFAGCASITEAPVLPATTLTPYCYSSMFSSCARLSKAPDLPASFARDSCYARIFYNCTSLSYIKCMLTSFASGESNFISDWVHGVPYEGVFYKDHSASIRTEENPNGFWVVCPTGFSEDSGIPCGWEVRDAY